LDYHLQNDSFWYPHLNPFSLINSTNGWYGIENLSKFSSRGPTFDGRTKPDVISVGEYVLSARAKAENLSPWIYYRGSSMSCPELVRNIAPLREMFRVKLKIANPSASLIKNLITTTTDGLTGNTFDPLNKTYDPNLHLSITANDQGFGRANFHKIIKNEVKWMDRVEIGTLDKPFIKCFVAQRSEIATFGLAWTDHTRGKNTC
jgi:hypothetical protein